MLFKIIVHFPVIFSLLVISYSVYRFEHIPRASACLPIWVNSDMLWLREEGAPGILIIRPCVVIKEPASLPETFLFLSLSLYLSVSLSLSLPRSHTLSLPLSIPSLPSLILTPSFAPSISSIKPRKILRHTLFINDTVRNC